MLFKILQRWNAISTGDLNRYCGYTLAKAALVVTMLLLLWALKDKDVTVVYMAF